MYNLLVELVKMKWKSVFNSQFSRFGYLLAFKFTLLHSKYKERKELEKP